MHNVGLIFGCKEREINSILPGLLLTYCYPHKCYLMRQQISFQCCFCTHFSPIHSFARFLYYLCKKEVAMLDSIESAIEDIRAGKLVVVVDDEDRENEG